MCWYKIFSGNWSTVRLETLCNKKHDSLIYCDASQLIPAQITVVKTDPKEKMILILIRTVNFMNTIDLRWTWNHSGTFLLKTHIFRAETCLYSEAMLRRTSSNSILWIKVTFFHWVYIKSYNKSTRIYPCPIGEIRHLLYWNDKKYKSGIIQIECNLFSSQFWHQTLMAYNLSFTSANPHKRQREVTADKLRESFGMPARCLKHTSSDWSEIKVDKICQDSLIAATNSTKCLHLFRSWTQLAPNWNLSAKLSLVLCLIIRETSVLYK